MIPLFTFFTILYIIFLFLPCSPLPHYGSFQNISWVPVITCNSLTHFLRYGSHRLARTVYTSESPISYQLPSPSLFFSFQGSGWSTPQSSLLCRRLAVGNSGWCTLATGSTRTRWPSRPFRKGRCQKRTLSKRLKSWCEWKRGCAGILWGRL